MASKIAGILSARVGMGNARVEVNVDLSTVRQVTRSERFDPEGQVVRSTETREQTSRDQQAVSQEVGAAGNLPSPFDNDAAGGAGGASETQSVDEIVNFEIGNTQTETVTEPGAIERVSVAALVDGTYVTDDEGNVTYAPREQAELDRLGELIRASIGFDAARGDTVSVDSLQFVDIATSIEGPSASAMSNLVSANLPAFLRGLFALAIVGAVLLLGLRPALRMLLESPPETPALADATGSDAPAIGDATAATPQIAAQAGGVHSGIVLPPGEHEDIETVQIASVQGGVSRMKVENMGALVTERPEAATQTVQGWLSSKPMEHAG